MNTETVPQVPNKSAGSKTPLLILVVLVLLVLAAGAYWYFFLRDSAKTSPTTQKTATTSAETTTKTTTTTTEKTAVPETPAVDDTALITKALVTKTGIAADVIDVTVSTKTDKLAKGLVSAKGEETGGGYFLAAKVNNDWVIVFDGQSTPPCSSVNPYSFPASMVPECVDSSGNNVTR